VSKGNKKSKRKIRSKKTELHKPASKTWLKYLLFIGLLACIMFMASRMFTSTGTNSNDSVISSFYEPMPLQLSETANIRQEFKDMANLYNDKKYKEVIPILDGFLQNKPDVKWNLYRGIAYFESGDLVQAEEDFKLLANSANLYLKDHGVWYQAICALKMGDKATAQTLIQRLANKPQGDYFKRAKEFLARL